MRSERGLSAGFAGARACEGNKTDELLYIIKISDEVSFTSSNIYSDIPPLVYITGLNNILYIISIEMTTKIYALVSGDSILYIGKTNNLKRRERFHRSKYLNSTGSKNIPGDLIWTMKLLETVSDDMGYIRERYYYDTLKPIYNIYKPGNYIMQRLNKDMQ